MEVKSPTEEQVKEFWKWCGFEYRHEEIIDASTYKIFTTSLWKDGLEVTEGEPKLDLNSLFRYAVPKLRFCSLQSTNTEPKYYAQASIQFADNHAQTNNDPALALFWAIYSIIEQRELNERIKP